MSEPLSLQIRVLDSGILLGPRNWPPAKSKYLKSGNGDSQKIFSEQSWDVYRGPRWFSQPPPPFGTPLKRGCGDGARKAVPEFQTFIKKLLPPPHTHTTNNRPVVEKNFWFFLFCCTNEMSHLILEIGYLTNPCHLSFFFKVISEYSSEPPILP